MKLSEMKKSEQKTENSQKKTIQENFDAIKDYSADELMKKLAQEIQGQKDNGTFDYEVLIGTIDKIKTYLPKQTYENMIRIIDSLK